MKTHFKRFSNTFLALTGSVILTTQIAQAATLYWDIDGANAGSGGATPSGTWSTGGTTWSTDSTGATATSALTTTFLDDLFFSAGSDAIGAYAISLNSTTQNARMVTFDDGTVTLTAATGTLSLGNGGGLTVTTNTVTGSTISCDLTLSGSQTFNVAASRTLILDTGTFTRSAGATLNVASTGTVTTTMTNLDSASLVNGIIGPWASFGSGASTRYATIDGSDNIVGYTGGTAAATAANVTDTLGTVNYDVAGGNATLGGAANINTFRYTGGGGTIAGALTTRGIMNVGGGALVFSGAMTSGSGGMVVNAANGSINFGAMNLNGNGLIVSGSGAVSFDGNAANIISNSGGIVHNGSGNLTLDGGTVINHTFTGGITINGGSRVGAQTGANLTGRGNVTINNGYLGARFGTTVTFAGGLGTGTTAIQILGGTSGFSGEGGTSSTFTIGTGGSVLKWGATGENGATGFFNPTVLLLNGTQSMNTNGKGSLNNGIDLNGTNRTITSTQVTDGAANSGFTISGVISNSTGTAGFEKTGVGNLILANAANTFNGALTITGGWITAGSSGALGGASNSIVFNGGTLRATGTITSAATRGVTMTQTGIIDNNGQAISIAGNIGGAGGLTKNGAGTLTLSGTNNYGGVTTVNAGTLQLVNEVSLASNTAANLNVKSGATLALNVGGVGQFTASTINTLLTNISVSNTAAQGLQAGAILAFDTTGGNFTQGNAITDSTGAFGGVVSLNKISTGILILDKANTYNGRTTISAGTLQLGSGTATGSLSTSSPINIGSGATFAVNQSDTVTQGTDFGVLDGVGSVDNIGAGTLVLNVPDIRTGNTTATAGNITLSHQRAIQFSALNTTGAGSVTLSGTGSATPIFGGLANSGTTRNLASVIDSSYASVSNLTLNPQSGSTFTYGGVIANGAADMNLTKTGAGTQILQEANTYSGDTFLNGGTLTLSGASGSILNSAITFNGGTLQLTNTTNAEGGVNRVSNTAGITSNGGTITYANTSVNPGVYAETIGSVALTSGQFNVVLNTSMAAGTQVQNNQTLALAGLSQSGTSAITFSAITTGLQTFGNRNMIRVNGIITDTAANQIIAPWATVGTAANAQTDYAVYDSDGADGYIVARNTAGSAETTWTTAANAYTTSAGGTVTLTGTRTITALRNTGASTVLTLATSNNLETYGLLNGAASLFTIAPGTGGVLTTPSGGGNLYLTTHGGNTDTSGAHAGITVTAPINDNGSDAVTLVKSGVGILQLNATSNYSGGTVLNSGTLWAQTDASLGEVNGDITFNGSATLLLSPNNGTSALNFTLPSTRTITVNNGAIATIAGGRANAVVTINGDISGDGGVTVGRVALLSNGGIGTPNYNFNLLGSNTFTGAFNVGTGLETSAGGAIGGVTINSLADSTNPITLNYGSGASFNLGSGASANLSVPNRPINLLNSNLTINNLSGTRTMTLGAVSTSTAGAKTLNLGAGGAGGIISGNISDGAGSIGITTTGIWVLSGTNTYSGQTSFSGNGVGLTFVGRQAASPNTTFVMNTSNSTASSTIRFLDNTGGVNDSTATFAGRYRLQSNNTSGITNNFFVGNDSTANGGTGSGTTTGSTMIIGTMDWNTVANGTTNVGNIAIQGANGYRLQINDVIMFNGSGHTAGSTNNTRFIPTTANVTLGNVTMAAGNAVNGVIPFLVLDGTSSDNRITGTISNASDVGTSLRPVNVTKSNTSTWILSGTNTYSGVTTVSGGSLVLDSANALPGGIGTSGGTSALTLSGGVIGLGDGNFTRSLAAAGTVTGVNFATGGGGWAAYDADRLVNLGGASASITWATANTGFNAQTLILSNATATHKVTLENPLDLTTATRTVQVDNGTATVDAELSGIITGGAAGALTKTGAGTLSLSNANTYVGVTTVSGGVLLLENATALPGGIATTGGTSNLTFNGGVVGLGVGNFTRSLNTAATVTAATFTGAGGWAAFGADRDVNLGGALATITWTTANTGFNSQTLILGSSSATHTVSLLNPIALGSGTRTVRVDNGSAAVDGIMSGVLSGTAAFTVGGGGTLGLTNANNSFNGVITIGDNTASTLTVQANSIGNVSGGNSSLGAPTSAANGLIQIGATSNHSTLEFINLAADQSSDRQIRIGSSTTGSGGAFILNNDADNTVTFSNAAFNVAATGTTTFNRVLRLGGSNTGNNTISGAIINNVGTSGGIVSVTKQDAGTWILTGTSTYTGATNVNQGILSIGTVATPTGSINNSAVTINGGNFRYNSTTDYAGALTFTTGTISGTNWNGSLDNLTIGANRTISPGNSPGTSNTGGQTWATGGTYEWEINNVTATAGADPGWDLLNGSGTLDITAVDGGEFTIEVLSLTLANAAGAATGFNDATSYNWMIANFNAITGFSADAFTIDTTQFALHNPFTGTFGVALGDSPGIGGDNTQIWLTYTAIPEPKAALLGCLGVLLILRRRR